MNEEMVVQDASHESPVPSESTLHTSTVENNLVALRKKLELEESARKVAERRAQELEQRSQQTSSPSQPVPVEEEDIQIDNEDYVQAKHIKSSTKKLKNP